MADKAATATTYISAGGAVFFGLNANEFAAIVAAVVAVLTFGVNVWFKAQHLKIARKRAQAEESDES